ncbi:MAG: type III secretion inner membrane ring lipoprotein SctJ [Chlamydiota bacterium]
MLVTTNILQRVKFMKISTLLLLLLIPLLSSCDRHRTIVNGLDEKEANEIIVLLSTKGVDAEKMKSTTGQGGGGAQTVVLWDVAVPEEESTAAMSILNNAGLPRRKSQNLLNIFSNTGLVPTDMGERIRYQAGLAEQIASTIRNIDGVLDADVLISFPKEDPLNPTAPKKDITASVYVKHSGVLDDPNTHLVSKIKNLVTSSVSGLKFDNVTLVPDRARFTEIRPQGLSRSDEDLQWVRLWTVTIAKNSITQFRIIFFSFSILILLLTLSLIWVLWKTSPLLKTKGGFKELFHLGPIGGKTAEKKQDAEAPEEKESEKPPEEFDEDEDLFGEESFADESADFGGEIDVSEDER